MWKKSDEEPAVAAAPQPPTRRPQPSNEVSTLGPSIFIKGDLTGEEDLVIRGRLQGEVRLEKNNVTVGQSGKIKADIYGKSIRVEGAVDGNLYGGQEVVIRASGRVQGNIVSPSVTLENGSKFKGAIDMEPEGSKKPEKSAAPSSPAAGSGAAPEPQPISAAPKPSAAPGTGRG